MDAITKINYILWKDFITEIRTKGMLASMGLFSILTILIFNFSFDIYSSTVKEIGPGILWMTFTFGGMMGLSRSISIEKENECLEGLLLCPGDRGVIYLGKLAGNVIFMFLLEAIIYPLFSIFFNFKIIDIAIPLTLIFLLANIGIASVGTLFSTMASSTKIREILLPVLLFPIVVPVIIAAVKSTHGIMEGEGLSNVFHWIKLIIAFDVIFVVLSFLGFEFITEG